MRKSFLHQLSFVTLTAFALLISFSSDANAQNRYYENNSRYGNSYSYYSAAWENGYRLGYGAGSNDYSYRNSYDVDRNKAYRDGDSGYRGEYGSKDQYKREFRSAYESGYRDGYQGRRSQVDYRNYGRNNDYYNRQVYRNNNRNYSYQNCPTPRNNRGRGWGNRF
ncbi:MAG: hypothetical protein HY819_07505 [Acidobacteria bacterium]|nr:hypothetical protein [Acidobacteriota bacterium]